MSAQTSQGMMQRMIDRWVEFRSSQTALAELDGLPPSLVEEIARDVQIEPATLREVVAHGQGADDLMERMLEALGRSRQVLEQTLPGILHDAAVACSTCRDKGRCRKELDAGTAAAHASAFCPNHPTFATLP